MQFSVNFYNEGILYAVDWNWQQPGVAFSEKESGVWHTINPASQCLVNQAYAAARKKFGLTIKEMPLEQLLNEQDPKYWARQRALKEQNKNLPRIPIINDMIGARRDISSHV